MIIPIRCFTCGQILGSKYKKYLELNKKNKNEITDFSNINKNNDKIMEKLGIKRYCCKRHILGQVDLFKYL